MIRRLVLPALLALSACAAPEVTGRLSSAPAALPPMKTFASPRVRAPSRSNAAIARDFMELAFRLESGRQLPVLSRFEGPVTVRVTGSPSTSLYTDLDRLIDRLRREAGIDISRVPRSETASITIEVISRAQLQRVVPQAACFVVPRVTSWNEYRMNRRNSLTDWTTLKVRDRMAIFLPGDVSPQEVRDCLHEEIAQALGPVNDLYRLPDSVFNDDNFHTVLTGFDMLILRAFYDPSLRSGMTEAQVAQRLPAILNRLNPRGRWGSTGASRPSTNEWEDAIETAIGQNVTPARRQAAARRAVSIAQQRGWNDNRLGFSLFVLGRVSLGTSSETALGAFLESGKVYARSSETELQAAHVAMQLAAFSLASNQPQTAIELVDRHIGPVAASENAALLSTMLMIKAEALETLGRSAEAEVVRLDSLGWARYGFGSDSNVRRRAAEIAALRPRTSRGS
ncbi:MAG: DUF2927 domain-containing protein [Rhodobacteraceae bacterium]|nr:DUF2927 domain-containing protein [Paracoccaceae bacterium]